MFDGLLLCKSIGPVSITHRTDIDEQEVKSVDLHVPCCDMVSWKLIDFHLGFFVSLPFLCCATKILQIEMINVTSELNTVW